MDFSIRCGSRIETTGFVGPSSFADSVFDGIAIPFHP
jgi:hypothetical protein